MRESDLSAPVCKWLRHRGLTVYCEFPWAGKLIDIVGIGANIIVAVELKVVFSWKVIKQAAVNQVFADESWCVVSTRPRSTEAAERLGLGVAHARGIVCILSIPRTTWAPFAAEAKSVRVRAESLEPGGVGGIVTPARAILGAGGGET